MGTSTGAGSYLICATPRSGSTLLCGLLGSTGIAGRPESYFRRPDLRWWADRWHLPRRPDGRFEYRDYVRAAVAAGSSANGVFGARVMWGTLDDIATGLGALDRERTGADLDLVTSAFGRTRFLHLHRGDGVAQAVSRVRAEQTGYWQTGDRITPGVEPYFDYEQIDAMVSTIEAENAAWRNWFTAFGIRPYEVRYEEMVADPAALTRGILDLLELELPWEAAIVPGHSRQADHINDEWIARYRASADPGSRPNAVR